jgi:hypothetical protein
MKEIIRYNKLVQIKIGSDKTHNVTDCTITLRGVIIRGGF